MKMIHTLAILAALSFSNGVAFATEPDEQAKEEARQRAIEIAADHLNVRADRLAVVDLEAKTWTDSSLGCPKPGRRYLPGVVEGYLVTVVHGGERLRVHLGGGRGLVCQGVLQDEAS
ncbi:hypothetical protein [Microbulbifer yueqingensis]|uniref:Uncharacterized protein n=1 Tax=Microbulbifer yueqingensis TaxID=658219 RepID=A0A1G9BV97_9GAMM|nr:hypothetical protein [Microbulbifer yueqingensis]SDK43074.1 hypothetical protein SAMN05216212_2370 [Microbulbifer yueqingensis]